MVKAQYIMGNGIMHGKGGTLGDPEMVPALELVECDVSVYCITFYQPRWNMNPDKILNIKMHNLFFSLNCRQRLLQHT